MSIYMRLKTTFIQVSIRLLETRSKTSAHNFHVKLLVADVLHIEGKVPFWNIMSSLMECLLQFLPLPFAPLAHHHLQLPFFSVNS